MKNYESTIELKEFIEIRQLKNNSNTFSARAEIQTEANFISTEVMISIQFGGYNTYGSLIIRQSKDEINPYIFPSEFDAKFQIFKFIDSFHLEITGKHKELTIGNYTVKIFPI